MDVRITPGTIAGQTTAPPSKSFTHRAIFAAGLGDGGQIQSPLKSADTMATAGAVDAFGGAVSWEDNSAIIDGVAGNPSDPADVIDCANSGTTLRLATAVAALVDGTTVLTGDASLRERPQGPLLSAIEQLGGQAESTQGTGTPPLIVRGQIDGGHVEIPGDVSSQFVTALLLAGACTPTGIEIALSTPLKSAPYVDITLAVLSDFGVTARKTADGYAVDGNQQYVTPSEYTVPGDFSSLSYLIAAGATAAPRELKISGVRSSPQGDAAIIDHVRRMGADVAWDRDTGRLSVQAGDLSGITVSVADTPDLLPTLAVLGAVADGTTRITDCEHVRYKETDRVTAMHDALGAMGADIEESSNELLIHGDSSALTGTTVDGRGDHRIVMALSVAALRAAGSTVIQDAEHVEVSYPKFFDVLEDLGVDIERIE